MNTPVKTKPPATLVLTALLSSGVTIVLSITYILLCTLALLFRYSCETGSPETVSGSEYFWNIVYRVYIQDECGYPILVENLTSGYTVFILVTITLSASVLSLIAAGTLTAVIQSDEPSNYINIIVYGYIGVCVMSLVVDLTFASHFGMDYTLLTNELAESSPGLQMNYQKDVIRYGAFLLMTISLKGYVAHAINIVLLVLLVVYAAEYHRQLRDDEHSIHKMGALNAFEHPRRNDDNWPQQPDVYPPFSRGAQINNAFNDEEPPRSNLRVPPRSDYLPNNSSNRSDSWKHNRAIPDPGQGSRPFSYLEEIKRPVPVRPPSSPAVEPQWRHDPWPAVAGPPVPAPDYSPQPPRRLKSALKSAYM